LEQLIVNQLVKKFPVLCGTQKLITISAFFLGGRRGTRTPKHFVNITGESKNFKMVIFLSQTASTPKHFFLEKSTDYHVYRNLALVSVYMYILVFTDL
jgi:hypothetical protein